MAITVKHSKVSTIPDDADTSLVRPSDWNADHTLVGLGTMAEQDANAVDITGGTVNNSTLTSDTVSDNLDFTPTTAPAYTEGRVWYDSTEKALAFYNDSSALAVHVSQDLIFKVINNTGSTIPNGSPVYVTGTSSGQTYPNVALAKADVAATSAVIGLTNGAIANGAIGYVTSQGTIDNVNTGTFTVGQVLYLSPYSAGQLMNTIPPTGITVQVGVATFINSSTGHIYVKQTTPLAVPASIITGQVAVANGGTGASTASGARTNLGLGTIATQNANAVAITGGTIDNAVIGATTPAAGTFTTITGQTGVLRGTGQNLVVQSQAFATTWSGSANLTPINNATTAPDSTSTASSLTEVATTNNHWLFTQTPLTLFAGTYTLSCYIKANGRTAAILGLAGNASSVYATATFDLSGVTVSQTNAAGTGFSIVSNSITSVGSGWYRCVSTVTVPARSDYLFMVSTSNATTFSPTTVGGGNSYLGDITKGIFAWGAQLEPYATVGTYIPTTTTSLLGNPTLSFGNLAYIGMENNGAVYVQPALTGAIQAQATTSTTAGGNARGANAVDWQTARNAASQVASATQSFLGGGFANSATATTSVVVGGAGNTASSQDAFIGSGSGNTVSGFRSSVVGGQSNAAAGYLNFIGGGFTNSGTANAAVTTQSGTMNATTAVTLSGSNASIKVGQYITGTSIATGTYVAAISGTSLTLSQAASGSSTSTLSFFTPHGVVVGGGNNQATGAYSFIGGGGDAGTAANRNVASGDWSVVGGGQRNTASGTGSFIGGGGFDGTFSYANLASGTASAIVAGQSNTASGNTSFVGSGYSNTANAFYSSVVNGAYGTTRSIIGFNAQPYCNAPIATSQGVSQGGMLILGVQTTDATATALRSNTAAAGTTNQVTLPNNSAYYFKVRVIAGVTGAGNTKAWTLEGAIKRGANAASTAIVGSVTTTIVAADVGAATWTVTATADTTNGGLAITVTGQASTTIRWVAKSETAEMTF